MLVCGLSLMGSLPRLKPVAQPLFERRVVHELVSRTGINTTDYSK
jgi:hypothetical protein